MFKLVERAYPLRQITEHETVEPSTNGNTAVVVIQFSSPPDGASSCEHSAEIHTIIIFVIALIIMIYFIIILKVINI